MCFSQFIDRMPHVAHARLCANERARHVANGTEQTKRAKSQKNKRANKTHSIGPSHVVPHHSTTPARATLTSLFGWEAVILACMAVCVATIAIDIYCHHRTAEQPSQAGSGRGGIVTTPVLRLLSVSRPRATHDQLSPRGVLFAFAVVFSSVLARAIRTSDHTRGPKPCGDAGELATFEPGARSLRAHTTLSTPIVGPAGTSRLHRGSILRNKAWHAHNE